MLLQVVIFKMLSYYGYKKCSTSSKAEKFLKNHKINYQFIDITVSPPSKEDLIKIIEFSGKPIGKFFNTSGVVYREMKLKDKLKAMSEDEKIDLLASNGKLLKRPIVYNGKISTVGFNENEFTDSWS